VEEVIAELRARAKASGYDLSRFLAEPAAKGAKASGGVASRVADEELAAGDVTAGKKIVQSEKERGGRRK
jgi:hypothetical protein